MRISAFLLLFAALGPTAGCQVVTGSGKAIEATRDVADFNQVDVDDDIQATVTVGPELSVHVRTDDNVLPLVQTSVEGGALLVRLPSGTHVSSDLGIQVAVTVPALTAVSASGASRVRVFANESGPTSLTASGSGEVLATGLTAPALEVSASGSSRVTATGVAPDVTLNASGASTLAVDGVSAERARLDVSGSCDVSLRASSTLEGRVSGSSRAHEHGHASAEGLELSGASTLDYAP